MTHPPYTPSTTDTHPSGHTHHTHPLLQALTPRDTPTIHTLYYRHSPLMTHSPYTPSTTGTHPSRHTLYYISSTMVGSESRGSALKSQLYFLERFSLNCKPLFTRLLSAVLDCSKFEKNVCNTIKNYADIWV